MNKRASIGLFALCLGVCTVWGQPKEFSYQRDLTGWKQGWNELQLPVTLYHQAKSNLSDLRVIGITANGDTVEAPYMLRRYEAKGQSRKVTLSAVNSSSRGGDYYLTLALQDTSPVSRLELQIVEDNFDWRVDISGSHDQQTWFDVAQDQRILAIKNEQTNYRYTTLTFPPTQYAFIRLKVKGVNNPKLHAELYTQEVDEGRSISFSVAKTWRTEKEKNTEIYLRFNQAIPLAAFQLRSSAEHEFYRRVTFETLIDSVQSEKGWRYYYRQIGSGWFSSLEENRFTFSNQLVQQLRITIQNQDNAPLPVSVEGLIGYPHYLQVRIDQPAEYILFYGNERLGKPHYDVARFKNNIESFHTAITLGEEVIRPKADEEEVKPLITNQIWLWIIMIVVILVLGGFTLRMIQKEE